MKLGDIIKSRLTPRQIRVLKRIGVISGISVGCFLLLVTIVINVVLSPSKLTPIVQGYADEYLDADVKIGSVEATFFSSFPLFGIKVNDGMIVSHAYDAIERDSARLKDDTLAVFSEFRAGINLMNTLLSGNISIGRLSVKNPQIRLVCDSLGIVNWNIVREDSLETDEANADTSSINLTLKHFEIENAKITYVDRQSKTRVAVRGFNAEADGNLNLDNLDLDIKLSDDRTTLTVDGTRYIRRLPLAFDGHVYYDYQQEKYVVGDSHIILDGHALTLDGTVQTDTAGVDMDLTYALDSPDVEKLFALIPKDIVSEDIEVKSGSIESNGYVRGRLDKENSPVVACNMTIRDVRSRYARMPEEIEDLCAEFSAYIDAQNPDSSHLAVDIFHFKGGKSEVESTIRMSELLVDPLVDCRLNAKIEMKSILDIFPMKNFTMGGNVTADLTSHFRFSQLRNGEFGRIKLSGNLDIDSLRIINDSIGLNLRNDAHLNFVGNDTLNAHVEVSNLLMKYPSLNVTLRDFNMKAKTLMSRDTTAIPTLIADVNAQRIYIKTDTVTVYSKNTKASLVNRPSKADKTKAHFEAALKSDTIFSAIFGIRGFTGGLDSKANYERISDTTWISNALVEFKDAKVFFPRYKLPVIATNTRITQNIRTIEIEKSHVESGRTSFDVKATVTNLAMAIMNKEPLVGSLVMNADTIDASEIMASVIRDEDEAIETSSFVSDTSYVHSAAADSMLVHAADADTIPQQAELFFLPRNINVSLESNIKCLIWNKMEMTDIRTKAETNKGCLHVKNVSFRHGDSQGIAVLAYKGHKRKKTAEISLFARWLGTDLEDLIGRMQLDTIVPMLNSVRGRVDCYLSLNAELDSMMSPVLSKANASLHVSGSKLTVLDGETFAKVSKIMMFKNKKENVIDSVSFNALLDSNRITILPFVANIDRYSAIIGGSQDLDMNLNYHASVVKSPLPFKAGVNIKGNVSDLKFGVTTAKLKKKATKEEQAKNDATTYMRRLETVRNTYLLSRLPMPDQIKNDEDRQREILQQQLAAARKAEAEAEARIASEEQALQADSAYNAAVAEARELTGEQ